MAVRYRIGSEGSRFTVQAFTTGLLSFLGHDPTFVARDLSGELWLGPQESGGAGLRLMVNADSLELAGGASPKDRAEIEARMRGEVLGTAAHRDVRFESTTVTPARLSDDRYRLRIEGMLSLRGVTKPHTVEAEMTVFDDAVRLTGESALWQSDYGIEPVTALGGAVRLKDQLRITFDLVGRLADQREGT
jgi:polyisoprenoid-binding protein YceI